MNLLTDSFSTPGEGSISQGPVCIHLRPIIMALSSISRIHWTPSQSALASLESGLAGLRIVQSTSTALTPTFRRHASHQAQGRANGAKDGPGKRLGSKKTAGEYVVTGNIIYKQRGTLWFPGDNCFMVS